MNFTQIKEAQNGWMTNHGFVPDNDSIHTCRELKKAIAAGATVDPMKSPADLENERQQSIRAECKRRILSIYSEHDQLNMLRERGDPDVSAARLSELNAISKWIDETIMANKTARANGTALVDIVWPAHP